MWFIGVEVEQETSAPPPKKNPGSAPAVFGCSNTGYPLLFTSEQRQTRVSYEQNGFPVCYRKKPRDFINKRRSCSRKHDFFFTETQLCLFNLNFSTKPVKNLFTNANYVLRYSVQSGFKYRNNSQPLLEKYPHKSSN